MSRISLNDVQILEQLEKDDESDLEFEGDGNITDCEDIVEREIENKDDIEHDVVENEIEHVIEDVIEQLAEDDLENSNQIGNGNETVYKSKSGYSWSSKPPEPSRRRQINIVTESSGLRNNAINVNTIEEMFKVFITKEIMDEIILETNRPLLLDSCPEEEKIKPVTSEEMNAFIGILLCAGRNRSRRLSFDELWTNDGPWAQPYFSAAMSRDRFKKIYTMIRFDDKATREARFELSKDKREAIKSIFNKLVYACKTNYSPTQNVTIDERLASFRGNCPFRVYMKSKPARYGIKIWVSADAETAYICNMQIYPGMVDNTREINQGKRVVMDLVEPIYGTSRGVTTDNFFTSIPLADSLLEKKLTLTGTLRANKREIPQDFLKSKNREIYTTLFGFTPNKTILSYVPQKNKAVILLSSQFLSNEVDESEKKKPCIIHHYNHTKGAVDTGDKMTGEYSCARSTRRWPFRIFMEMLDIAALNAYKLWILKNPDWSKNDKSKRKKFIRELCLSLAVPNIEKRKRENKNLKNPQKIAMDLVLSYYYKSKSLTPVLIENTNLLPASPGPSRASARNCRFCPYDKVKRSTISCHNCKKVICNKHRKETSIASCIDCENL